MDLPVILKSLSALVPKPKNMQEIAAIYKRTVNHDYFFKLKARRERNIYKLTLQKTDCPKERIAEQIFYVKLPSNVRGPYSCAASLKQIMKPVGLEIDKYAPFQMSALLPTGHHLKKPLLELATAWHEGRIAFECSLAQDKLAAYLKEKRYKKPLDAPTTLVLEDKEIMQDFDCQQAWYNRHSRGAAQQQKGKSRTSGKCLFCDSDADFPNRGSDNWKLYTVTRKTQLIHERKGYRRCKNCETELSNIEKLLDEQRISIGKETYQYCLPLVRDVKEAELLIKQWVDELSKKKVRNKFEKATILRDLVAKLELYDVIHHLIYINVIISRQKTFEVKQIQVVSVNKIYIQKALNGEQVIKELLANHGISRVKAGYALIRHEKINKHYTDKTMNLITNLKLGATPFDHHYLSSVLRKREKEIAKINALNNQEVKNTVGLLLHYELLYEYLKGVDIMSLVDTKEYATGVLLNIAKYAQVNKYSTQEKKNYNVPIARKFVRVHPKDFARIVAESNAVFNSCGGHINSYGWKMINHAMTKMDQPDMDNSDDERLVAFYMGYRAWDYYPDVEPRPESKKESDQKDVEKQENTEEQEIF